MAIDMQDALKMEPGKERRELIVALLEGGLVDRILINTKYTPQLHQDVDLKKMLKDGTLVRHRVRRYPSHSVTTLKLATKGK